MEGEVVRRKEVVSVTFDTTSFNHSPSTTKKFPTGNTILPLLASDITTNGR